jgi:diguanylate cyclase (GGDEF)-like protein
MSNMLTQKTSAEKFLADLEGVGTDGPLSVALADLDDFLAINERFGREGGDRVLESWERTLKGSLPKECTVHRIGGDEYAIALPEHSAESALIVLQEIRDHFASHPPTADINAQCDVSIGVASRPPHATATADLLHAAHGALARAKREGRGRVAIYVEEKMVLKSNYYARASLERLAKLSEHTGRTEASLLREALDDVFTKYRDLM